MKKLIFVLAIGTFFVTATAFKVSSHDKGEGKTYSGTLVDSKCYSMMPKANAGNDHMTMGENGKMMEVKGCATACANMGIPVALLDKEGNLHVISAPANQLAPYMAKEVKITGKKMKGVLLVDNLLVKEKDSWEKVNLVYMMK